jgi:hypothetical protein
LYQGDAAMIWHWLINFVNKHRPHVHPAKQASQPPKQKTEVEKYLERKKQPRNPSK